MSETLNVGGAAIAASFARMVIAQAYRVYIEPRACYWRMHPMQKVMVENVSLTSAVIVEQTKDGKETEISYSPFDISMCGLNVVVDAEMPEDVIELRYGPELVAKIVNLSVPVGYVP